MTTTDTATDRAEGDRVKDLRRWVRDVLVPRARGPANDEGGA